MPQPKGKDFKLGHYLDLRQLEATETKNRLVKRGEKMVKTW
jgi:hypothetical protein